MLEEWSTINRAARLRPPSSRDAAGACKYRAGRPWMTVNVSSTLDAVVWKGTSVRVPAYAKGRGARLIVGLGRAVPCQMPPSWRTSRGPPDISLAAPATSFADLDHRPPRSSPQQARGRCCPRRACPDVRPAIAAHQPRARRPSGGPGHAQWPGSVQLLSPDESSGRVRQRESWNPATWLSARQRSQAIRYVILPGLTSVRPACQMQLSSRRAGIRRNQDRGVSTRRPGTIPTRALIHDPQAKGPLEGPPGTPQRST